MDNIRKLKRGEILFKEGDPVQIIFVIQSGKVGLMSGRPGKMVEVTALGATQVIGEQALFTAARHEFTGEALQDCKILEVPLEAVKQQFEKSAPLLKILSKSLAEESRQARKQFKLQKLETEKAPCPQGHVHKLFGAVQLVVRHIGTKATVESARGGEAIAVSWDALRLYATRFFGESPIRLRGFMDLLFKLKMADFKVAKTEEGEETLTDLKILSVQVLEDFAEFYQHNLYKGSRAEPIFVDPLALKVAKAFFELSEGSEPDFRGATHLNWIQVLSDCKTRYRLDLKSTHLDVLERKGLFVKRQSFDDGRVDIAFDRNEFKKMAVYWGILLEIEKWNDKGSVDLNEKETDAAVVAANVCPSCAGPIDESHKFCPGCGAKLTPMAAVA